MPDTWEAALQEYRYPVDLTEFEHRCEYLRWFQSDDSPHTGNRTETADFEDRFRKKAEHDIEAWYEVVFWKIYSQGKGRATYRTQEVICRIQSEMTTADELWDLCVEYTCNESRESFVRFKNKIHEVSSPMVAIAATFPAFICPTRFPMVDTEVTKWARRHGSLHAGALDISIAGKWRNDDVRIYKWGFVESWIDWCRYTRDRLNESPDSKREWRARDVEMAVFTVQRCNDECEKSRKKCDLYLNPLGS